MIGKRGRKVLTSAQANAWAEAVKDFNWRDPKQRMAIAETIVFDLKETIDRDDIISLLQVDVREFAPGQTPQWRTRKGIKSFISQPGSYAPRSQMNQRVQTLTTERVHAHPEIEIIQLQSGRYGDVQDIRDEALAELLGRKYGKIWTTAIGSVATSDANYWATAATPNALQKKAALDSGFNYVADQQNSEITAIVGRRNALEWLSDYDAYVAGTNAGIGMGETRRAELDGKPFPDTYRGIPVVYLNQYTDGWNANVIDESEIMILGRDTVKLGVDTPLTFLEEIDVDTATWHLNIFESYGVGVFDASRNARVVLS
jgi:hypothetical protein